MRKTFAALLTAAVVILSVTACAADEGTADGTPDGTGDGQTIKITFDGDSVEPNGERVKVDVDQPVVLKITADAPGEIHVHSTPEQEIAYDAGTSEHTLTIDTPGVVDVESHDLDKTIVQLQAS
jgi:hypothetical protein